MKVWRNFKKVSDAIPGLRNRNCWKNCDTCKKKWSEIETEYVHLYINPENQTRYLCDYCLPS